MLVRRVLITALAAGTIGLLVPVAGCPACRSIVVKLVDNDGNAISEREAYTVTWSLDSQSFEPCASEGCGEIEGGCIQAPRAGLHFLRVTHKDGQTWNKEVNVPDGVNCGGTRVEFAITPIP